MIANKKLMGSGKWQTWTVAKILSEEVYTGDMVQGKHNSVGHKQVCTKPEDWVVVRNTHEPLIDRNLFARVQALRGQSSRQNQAPKVPYTENILRGRVFCGWCGKNLHRQKLHGRYIYHCISNDRIGKGACPGKVLLHETDLFAAILTIIRRQVESIIGKRLCLQQYSGRAAVQKAAIDKEISGLQHKAENNRKFLLGLLESFNSGLLTQAEYLEMKEDYSQAIRAAVDRVQQLQSQQKALEDQVQQYISLADRLTGVDKDTELSTQLVNQLIERVTVKGSNDVSIQFRFEGGFEHLMEALENE